MIFFLNSEVWGSKRATSQRENSEKLVSMKTNSSRQKNGSNDGLVAIVPATRATRISFLRSYQFSHSFVSRRFNIVPERNRTTHKPASNLTGGYLHRARLYSRLSQGRRQVHAEGQPPSWNFIYSSYETQI